MYGDVARVVAGTKAIERVSDTTVGAGDAALAIPVDGALVDAGGGRVGPPVRKVHICSAIEGVARRTTVDPEGVMRGVRWSGDQQQRHTETETKQLANDFHVELPPG